MNDVLVDCKHEVYFNNGKIDKETYLLKTYQNYVSDVSGLAIRLTTKVTPKSIVMKKIGKGKTEAVPVEFAQDDQEKNVYYLTNNVTREINSTYILELTYSDPQSMSKLATIEPFLYRDLADGRRWEVHLQGKKPTSKMDMSFFRTYDDASSTGNWYQSNSFYPFAFYLANAKAENFTETILKEGENKPISTFYPEFLQWSTSNGEKFPDWYLHPRQ
jgi:LruC domain-containing protein